VLDDGGRPSDHDRGRILLVDRPFDRGRVVAAGLDRPVGMARLPDGSYIVAETDNDPPSPAHTPG
jgi:glucose/arabinose dehydrogenase